MACSGRNGYQLGISPLQTIFLNLNVTTKAKSMKIGCNGGINKMQNRRQQIVAKFQMQFWSRIILKSTFLQTMACKKSMTAWSNSSHAMANILRFTKFKVQKCWNAIRKVSTKLWLPSSGRSYEMLKKILPLFNKSRNAWPESTVLNAG